jgi:hypothetical protein
LLASVIIHHHGSWPLSKRDDKRHKQCEGIP